MPETCSTAENWWITLLFLSVHVCELQSSTIYYLSSLQNFPQQCTVSTLIKNLCFIAVVVVLVLKAIYKSVIIIIIIFLLPLKDKGTSFGCREDMPLTIKVQGQDVMVVEEFVYLGSLIHSSTGSTCDISRRSAITHAAMQSLENQIWRSRPAISMKLKL